MSAVMHPHYYFRAMQMTDLNAVMAIESTIYSHPWTRGNFSDALQSGYQARVIEDNHGMIGYALAMTILDEVHLLNLSIAKPFQGQGLGRALLVQMMDIARQQKALNMFLEVRESNKTAIALYESIGFCEISVRKGYYPADKALFENGREDAILMGLAL